MKREKKTLKERWPQAEIKLRRKRILNYSTFKSNQFFLLENKMLENQDDRNLIFLRLSFASVDRRKKYFVEAKFSDLIIEREALQVKI